MSEESKILAVVRGLQYHFEKDGIIPRIDKKVEKTNGRVTVLEKFMWTMGGGLMIVSMVIGVPKVIDVVKPEPVQAEMSREELKILITEISIEIINNELDEYAEN